MKLVKGASTGDVTDAVRMFQERGVFPTGFEVHLHACACGRQWACAHRSLRCAKECDQCADRVED